MLSKSEFYNLKRGDLLLWNYKVIRPVLQGYNNYGIILPKIKRSHIDNPTTTYTYNDIKNRATKLNPTIKSLLLLVTEKGDE